MSLPMTGLDPKFDADVSWLAEQVANGFELPCREVGDRTRSIMLTVQVLPDSHSDPAEDDCYSETDVETFREGEWRFVGIRAVIEMSGVRVESGGTWSVERGRCEGNVESEYLADIISAQFGEAMDTVRELANRL